jgi:hypothetical protein
MDPFTLFALASGAVNAVKKGCQLYKEIKGVAGDVKGVLKDLDQQFFNKYPGGKAPKEAIKQFNEEKARIKELGEKNADDVYAELGEQLGAYYENYAKCKAIFLAEEKHAEELYAGDVSVGKRALQRVLMRKKLEAMAVELREVMVYQSPPELGALYTEVSEMMERISAEQEKAVAVKMEAEARDRARRRKRMKQIRENAIWGVLLLIAFITVGCMFAWLVNDRAQKYPHLGGEWVPKTEKQRIIESGGYRYTGR